MTAMIQKKHQTSQTKAVESSLHTRAAANDTANKHTKLTAQVITSMHADNIAQRPRETLAVLVLF